MPILLNNNPNPQAIMLGKQHLRKIMLGRYIVWQRRRRQRETQNLILESLTHRGIRLRATSNNGNLRYPMHFQHRRRTDWGNYRDRLTFIAKQPAELSLESMDAMLQADVVGVEMLYPMFFIHGEPLPGYKFRDKLTFLATGDNLEIGTDFVKDFETNAYCPENDFIKDFVVAGNDTDYSKDFYINAFCPNSDFIKDFEVEGNDTDFVKDFEVNVYCPDSDYIQNFDIEVKKFTDFTKDFSVPTIRTADFTKNFTVRAGTLVPNASWSWNDITYGNGLFVAVGKRGHIITSPDGITWTQRFAPGQWTTIINGEIANNLGDGLTHITYGNGLFVAIGSVGITGSNSWRTQVITSPDGITWTMRHTMSGRLSSGVTYGDGLFAMITRYITSGNWRTEVTTSTDGITWTQRETLRNEHHTGIAHGNGIFVMASTGQSPSLGNRGGQILTSPNAITWTEQIAGGSWYWDCVGSVNDLLVVVGINRSFQPRISTSPDGTTWTPRAIPASAFATNWSDITHGNGMYVIVGWNGRIITSQNTITWTQRSAPRCDWTGVAHANNTFVAVGYDGSIITSPNATTWTRRSAPQHILAF
jgi:hypothetical protein